MLGGTNMYEGCVAVDNIGGYAETGCLTDQIVNRASKPAEKMPAVGLRTKAWIIERDLYIRIDN